MLQRATVSAEATRSHAVGPPTRHPKHAPSHSIDRSPWIPWSGNQSRLRSLAAPPPNSMLQRKLAIGATNDPLELEADRTADRILRMPEKTIATSPAIISNGPSPTLRRCSCGSGGATTCAKCKDEELQRKQSGPTPIAEAPGIVHEVLRSSGQPLDRATRAFFEPRFDHDFSRVRIHTGARAAESARQVNALAYTVGSNVVFRAEQFAPNTASGRRLLAHELTHVVQQSRNSQSASATLRRDEAPPAPSPAPTPKSAHQPNPANGCYADLKVSGRGEYKAFANRWVLWNFDVDQHYIKKRHFDFLRDVVAPKINATPAGKFSVNILGEASTTADFAYNLDLSKARANCVAEELVAAGLDDQHRTNMVLNTGELRGDLEQISHGIDPRIGIEDSTKRMVTIFLAPAGECTSEQRSRASHEFYVKVACRSENEVRINIGTRDSSPSIYREFAWFHDPWPDGCNFIPGLPPDFKSHYDVVLTGLDLRLATKDPDEYTGPSDFSGPLTFFAFGANEFLAKNGLLPLFKIGLGGEWNPQSCGAKNRVVDGELVPLGPVECGWAPDPPGHCSFTEKECSDDHKMAASKRFNAYMWGGSISAKEVLELLEKEAPGWAAALERLVDKIPGFIRDFFDPGAIALNVKFGTRDPQLTPSLTRSFVFLGIGNQGGGSSFINHFQGAVAPEQDAEKPSQLATQTPNSLWASSDLSAYLGKVVINGASNKIELSTGAGTFEFFSPLCNHGGTRTYRGPFLPRGRVQCPDDVDLPVPKEKECKDEEKCSESTRTAGHKQFTAKIGRATLASLPLIGREYAKKLGCKVGGAFLNIQSEDGDKDKQIHRNFFVVFREKDCRFTVGHDHASITGWFNRRLAIDDPDNILADSDFHPGAELTKDGDLRLISASNFPVIFKLPGIFDPTCKVRSREWGFAVPTSAVECGPAEEPPHDATPTVDHTDDCNQFRKQHEDFVDEFIRSIADQDYQDLFAKMSVGSAIIPPDEAYDYSLLSGHTVTPAVFIALAPNPQAPKGPPIQVVAFADLYIDRVYLNGWMEVDFLSDICAFDQFGNVVLIRPNHCLEDFAHSGTTGMINLHPFSDLGTDEKLPPPRRNDKKKSTVQPKLAIGSVNDPLETEADRTADRVLSMPDPSVSTAPTISHASAPALRRCSCGGSCDFCRKEDETLRRKSSESAPSGPTTAGEAPSIVHETLGSPGEPLDPATRAFMEPRFGRDFSAVRVHTGARAAESAESIHALAYTAGQDIVFSHNTYAPSTDHGRKLLGHELAHTIQQQGSGGTPPSPAPDGIFESSADAAGRAVANGQSISADLPASGFGLSRSLATPDVYNDEDLARAIQETSDRLKQASYPGRDSDVDWLAQLKAVAARRASFNRPPAIKPPKAAGAPKAAAPRKPPQHDPAADRAAAVAEAQAAAAQIDQDLTAEDDDEPPVTPMAISDSKSTVKPAPKASAKPAAKPRHKTPDPEMARFLPGGFTDEDVYKDSDAAMKRIDERIAREREIAKTPYDKRLQAVRIKLQAKSEYWYSRNEAFSHMTGDEVWSEGMADDLFTESEKQSVYEDQKSEQQFIDEKMAEDARNARAKFNSDQYQNWVDQGEQRSSSQAIIQPLVVGAAAPELIAAAYFGIQSGAQAGETYNACVHGTKEECAIAGAKLAAQIALERATKGKPGEAPTNSAGAPPPPEDLTFPRGTDVTNASAFPPPKMPTPVSESELVASSAQNPASIKPQEPQVHQHNWQNLGGKGTAPPAYRDPEGNVRVSTDSPLLQPGTRAGISPIRPGQSGPSAPKKIEPVPVSPSTSSPQQVGTADTGRAPASPAPDPLSKTPAAPAPPPAPPAAAPAEPAVSPHEKTGQADSASQRAVAQSARKQIAPPQAISEEAVERMQNNPRTSPPGRKGRGSGGGYAIDHDHHELAWRRLGGHNDAPPAFVYDNQLYLDPSRWPPKH